LDRVHATARDYSGSRRRESALTSSGRDCHPSQASPALAGAGAKVLAPTHVGGYGGYLNSDDSATDARRQLLMAPSKPCKGLWYQALAEVWFFGSVAELLRNSQAVSERTRIIVLE